MQHAQCNCAIQVYMITKTEIGGEFEPLFTIYYPLYSLYTPNFVHNFRMKDVVAKMYWSCYQLWTTRSLCMICWMKGRAISSDVTYSPKALWLQALIMSLSNLFLQSGNIPIVIISTYDSVPKDGETPTMLFSISPWPVSWLYTPSPRSGQMIYLIA